MVYRDIWYQSVDGIDLYARDYGPPDASLTVLCLPGLTRNSADFEDVCEGLPEGVRAIAVDQRGRGKSGYDPDPQHYEPATYVGDMFTLIDYLGLDRVVLLGTSLGGLMTMMMNAMRPDLFVGAIINDIGPEVNPAGLDRIKSYVGMAEPVEDLAAAVEQTRTTNEVAFPRLSDVGWKKFAERLYEADGAGGLRLAYDPEIATPIAAADESAVPPDLWPLFDLLSETPLLLIRGERSDILHADCLAEMKRRHPRAEAIEVASVGHAPLLDEPGVMEAISAFVSRLN